MNSINWGYVKTCRYGDVLALSARIQGSNILTILAECNVRKGGKTITLPPGTILVPDWRDAKASAKPLYRIYRDLNSAIRGVSNAVDSSRVEFSRMAEPSSRFELVFGDMLASEDLAQSRAERAARVGRHVGIQKSLVLWREALWLEREQAVASSRALRAGAEEVLAGRAMWRNFHALCGRERMNFRSLPFADTVGEVVARILSMPNAFEADGRAAYAEILEDLLGAVAEEERRQALEDVDTCFSRGESFIRRRRFRNPAEVENVIYGAFNLLGQARTGYKWRKRSQKGLDALHERIRKMQGAVRSQRITDARYQLKLARNSLAGIICS
jgi:hypothetical protein